MTLYLVTKPGEPCAAMARELSAVAGATALHLPAFEVAPCSDPQQVRARLARLPDYDLAIFVSPSAALAVAPLLDGGWPAATRIAAVGAASAAAVRRALRLPPTVRIIAPDHGDDENGPGSEALWRELAAEPAVRRALILRAEQGREWLAERLREAGAQVDTLAVYRRLERSWRQLPEAARLPAALAATRTVLVVTSSEAVQVAVRSASELGVLERLRSAVAVTMHPRVATALRSAGFAEVHTLARLDAATLLTLEPR